MASTSVALPSDVYGVDVSFAGDDYYHQCETTTDTLLTVPQAGSKVTGGGWITPQHLVPDQLRAQPDPRGGQPVQGAVPGPREQRQVQVPRQHRVGRGPARGQQGVVEGDGQVEWGERLHLRGRRAGQRLFGLEEGRHHLGEDLPDREPGQPGLQLGGAKVLKGGNLTVHK